MSLKISRDPKRKWQLHEKEKEEKERKNRPIGNGR